MSLEDVTPEMQKEADNVDVDSKEAVKKLKSRRPNMNFIEMGIPIGSQLKFSQSEDIVEVISGRKVIFNGDELSLTAVTRTLLENEHDVQPAPYWTFNGKGLKDIYEETYEF